MEKSNYIENSNIYLTIEDLKGRYRVINGATIYKWIREKGYPKQIKIGGKALWSRLEVEAYDEKQFSKRYEKND